MGGHISLPVSAIAADKTFIVTGSNAGMGYHVAKTLAKLGGRVIVACRSEEKAHQAIEQMKKEHQDELSKNTSDKQEVEGATSAKTPSKPQTLNLEFMKLDLSSLAATMEFINAYKATGYPLHALVCNAGILTTKQVYTDDDYEIQFQVNFLGHQLVLLHMLPLLKKSAPNSRVVYVTTGAFSLKTSASFDINDMQGRKHFNGGKMHTNSKLHQVMSMYALERRLNEPHIGLFAVNPGMVSTNLLQNVNDMATYAMKAGQALRLVKSPYQGATVILNAVLDPAYDNQRAFYFDHKCDKKSHDPGVLAKNVEKQESLWKYTLGCLKDYITDDIIKELEKTSEQQEGACAAAH